MQEGDIERLLLLGDRRVGSDSFCDTVCVELASFLKIVQSDCGVRTGRASGIATECGVRVRVRVRLGFGFRVRDYG